MSNHPPKRVSRHRSADRQPVRPRAAPIPAAQTPLPLPIGQGLDEPFDQPAQRGTRTPAGGTADSAAQNGVALPGERERVRANVVEDDVARILREAAEQEPDPTRKAALWEEYDKYVKNL